MKFFYLFILFIIIVKSKDISNEVGQTDLLDELTGFQIERALLYLKFNFEIITF